MNNLLVIRETLQYLSASGVDTERLARCEEAITELEAQLAQLSAGEAWETVCMGERVMCACGDPQCYAAIQAIDHDLLIYADVSDKSESAIVVQLPDDWRVQRKRGAE